MSGLLSGQRMDDRGTWLWNEEVQGSIPRRRLVRKKGDSEKKEESQQEYKDMQHKVKR